MLERAVDLIERLDLMYLNKSYLSAEEKELSEVIDKFMEDYDNA